MSFEVKTSEGLVEVIVDDFREFVDTYSSRVSRDGVFIETPDKLDRGQLTVVQLRLADGFMLVKAQAMVAWNRGDDDALGRPEGIGFHFLEIDPDCTDLLDRIVAEHKEQGGLAFSVDREAPGGDNQRGASEERLHSIVADREGGESSLEGIEGRAKGAIDVMPDPDDGGFAPGMERGGQDETLPEMGDKLDSMLAGSNEPELPAAVVAEGTEAEAGSLASAPADREMNIDDLDSAFDDMIQASGEQASASPVETDAPVGFDTVMVKDIDFDALKPPGMQTEAGDSSSPEDGAVAAASTPTAPAADDSGDQAGEAVSAEEPSESGEPGETGKTVMEEPPVDPLPEGDGIEHLSEPVSPIEVSGQLEMDKRLLDDGYLEEPGFWRSSSGVLVLIVAGIALLVVVFLVFSNLSAGAGDSPATQSAPEEQGAASEDADADTEGGEGVEVTPGDAADEDGGASTDPDSGSP